MNLRINNLDLPYTIDTYGMFNGENSEEGEAEYYRDEMGLTEAELQNMNYDYDHKQIVKDFANESVNLLQQNLVDHNASEGIVLSISEVLDTHSPQWYNFTTDSYISEWEIDFGKLKQAVLNHSNAEGESFQQYLLNSSWGLLNDGESEDETLAVAMLDFILPSIYSTEDYNMSMWERESEIYYENRKPTAEFQKIIDSKESK